MCVCVCVNKYSYKHCYVTDILSRWAIPVVYSVTGNNKQAGQTQLQYYLLFTYL
jgi:hypothetical protein